MFTSPKRFVVYDADSDVILGEEPLTLFNGRAVLPEAVLHRMLLARYPASRIQTSRGAGDATHRYRVFWYDTTGPRIPLAALRSCAAADLPAGSELVARFSVVAVTPRLPGCAAA